MEAEYDTEVMSELFERHRRELEEAKARDIEPLMRDERWDRRWLVMWAGNLILQPWVIFENYWERGRIVDFRIVAAGITPADACRAALEKGAGS